MKFEKLDIKNHRVWKVAELIYETDVDTLDFFFGNKDGAVEIIEKLVIAGKNTTGYEKIHVVSGNDNWILGVLVSFQGNEIDKKQEMRIIRENFNLYDILKLTVIDIIDRLFLADLESNDYYLACVSVDEEFRGIGIGTFILENSLRLAKERGLKRVVLDVNLDNSGAKRLYERFGFSIFGKKSFPWFGGRVGAYNMEFII